MKNKGFTLIELLVVLALFSTVVLIVGDIFLSVSRTQKYSLQRNQLMNDFRYNLEFIAQNIRLNKISYTDYPIVAEPEDELVLRDGENNKLIFKKDTVDCLGESTSCLKFYQEGEGWQVMSSENININKLDFYIKPLEDPFILSDNSYLADDQPLVTIILTGQGVVENSSIINLQTTVSSRIYER